jgi:type VI protein secretion system component Hcp
MRSLHRPSALFAALLTLLALFPSAPAHAAGPKPIGTVTFVGRPDLASIPIVDFQWAARNSQTVGGGGAGAGKASFDAFRITKLLDAAAPALFDLTVHGLPVDQVRVDVTVRRGTTASYVLSTVVITANDRHLTNGTVLQDISLAAVAIEETIVTPGGTVSTCFDVALSKTCD